MELLEAQSDPMLQLVGRVLGIQRCWLYQRRFHFSVGHEWSIAVCPDSAGRIRVEACRWTLPTDTVWVLAGDEARLAGCVRDLLEDIEASGGELWQHKQTGFIETSG